MVFPTLSVCSAMFGCQRGCWNAERSFLIFHVITWSNDHMTWLVGSSNLKLILCQIRRLQVLWKSSYKIFNLSRDHIIKRWHDLVDGIFQPQVTTLPSLVVIGIVDIRFYNCCVTTTWSKGHLLRMWGLPMVSYHPAKSDGHRYSGSVDISFLNLSCDCPIKRSHVFEGGVHRLQVTTLPRLVSIVYCGRVDIKLFICFCVKYIQNKDQVSISKFIFRWPYI